jgi:hypothetical protein
MFNRCILYEDGRNVKRRQTSFGKTGYALLFASLLEAMSLA